MVEGTTGLPGATEHPTLPARRDRPILWARDAAEVRIWIDGREQPCERIGESWTPVTIPADGSLYRFIVDGTPVPDPRSRSQPDGVHGPSRWIAGRSATHSGTERSPNHDNRARGALDRAVIYELHIGTFTHDGTFVAAIDHLDHLVSLGVTHVELMPVAAFDGDFGWGYDGVDLFATHPLYGGVRELGRLVDACHDHGLAVLLDVVLNHLGPSGNYLAVSGPYFTDRYRTPWGDAMNLDGPGSDGVRRFLLDAACYWLEDLDFDGLRLDATHALFDTSAVPILEQLSREVASIGDRSGHPRLLIAESDRLDPRILMAPPSGPGIDAVWADDLHHAIHVELTGETTSYYRDVADGDLERALLEAQTYQGRYSPNRQRTVGRPVTGTKSSAFVVSLQNHDQIGNRAAGERIHHLAGAGRVPAAAALVMLSPFTVMMFQGEEWMATSPFPYFSDHSGDLGEAVRMGRLSEFEAFGWTPDQISDPQDPATFIQAKLPWHELEDAMHADVLDWYRSLIELRRHPALAPVVLPSDHVVSNTKGLVTIERGTLLVAANLADEPRYSGRRLEGDVLAERGEISDGPHGIGFAPGAVVVMDSHG